ncbi:MAG: type II toxin-antitoxin system VapC family toxin [Planctomycetota bacterium]|nr:MAG: type II toxin-antitoxin system VapC family toxin [Planctomycetota bacterium]REK21137.1 MAG: type II toxin-antitoxin system VapC family toxin [Planctomycetota bacterium]REK29545.1 MAG: type II toxin-antitoxin system VapC family toxin [Planctomycetota bacterium]
MNVALDTNAYSDYVRGDAGRLRVIQSAQHVFVPLFVIAELRVGFAQGSKAKQNARTLQSFLNEPDVTMLAADDATTYFYAQLIVQLRRQGTPIPTNDVWIAALVIQHNLVLCTSDQHFHHLPQIPRC